MKASEAMYRFMKIPDIHTIIDIGSGDSVHATILRGAGKSVCTIALQPPADVVNDYMRMSFFTIDGIWASHVLEHIPNVGDFLKKCYSELKENGVLAITVPPLKHSIVGGHVSLWNEGLLLYRLILAGFDCREAMVGVYGYNISVIVRKKQAILPTLSMDSGDINLLAPFFPMKVSERFNGQCGNINWDRGEI
jgi:hypothetical protein